MRATHRAAARGASNGAAQHGPHANTPEPHVVAGLAARPHVTTHSLLPVHVALQSPSHFTLHAAESAHAIVLLSPTCSLQFELVLHVTIDLAPSFTSHVELAVHVTWLASPPVPLHSDESLQVSSSSSVDVPWHLLDCVQSSEHAESPQSVLQSAPATHSHAVSAHEHPVPVQTGARSSPLHAVTTKQSAISHRAMVPSVSPWSARAGANANARRTTRNHAT
jgi:hypothetical protein